MINCIHEDDLPVVVAKWETSVAKKIRFDDIHRIKIKHGGYIKCRMKALPDLDDDGNLKCLASTVDILERL